MSASRQRYASQLIVASVMASGLFAVAMLGLYLAHDSKLILAQAADSVADMLSGGALLWAVRLSAKPADDGHPFGHHSAQPIAAFAVALLACVLALEVIRDAVVALLEDGTVRFDWVLIYALGVKVVFKALLATLASRHGGVADASALKAFRLDARNDVLIGSASAVGLLLTHWWQLPALDAWLSLPVAAWVGYSGATLAFESGTILMGAAAPAARSEQLRALAAAVPGVMAVSGCKARHLGEQLRIWLEVRVDPDLTIGAAHDIGEQVEAALLQQTDVAEAVVHVDAAATRKSPTVHANSASP